MDRVVLGPMFIGRSSVEPRGERAHRGAGEATAPVDPTWSDLLVAYPLADNVALVPLDGTSAQSCSDKRQVRGGYGRRFALRRRRNRHLSGRRPVTRGTAREP